MSIDLSDYHLERGNALEMTQKLNGMIDAVEEGVNGGLVQIDENLEALSNQITSDLGDAVAVVGGIEASVLVVAGQVSADKALTLTYSNNASASAALALGYVGDAESARDAAIAIVYGGDFSIDAEAGSVPIADTDGRIGQDWLDIGTDPNQLPLLQFLGSLAFYDKLPAIAFSNAAPTVASATSIIIQAPVTFVSGTTSIGTILAPGLTGSGGCQITLIPTGLWSTTAAGNIALATTGVVSKALTLTYDSATAKWYPSY